MRIGCYAKTFLLSFFVLTIVASAPTVASAAVAKTDATYRTFTSRFQDGFYVQTAVPRDMTVLLVPKARPNTYGLFHDRTQGTYVAVNVYRRYDSRRGKARFDRSAVEWHYMLSLTVTGMRYARVENDDGVYIAYVGYRKRRPVEGIVYIKDVPAGANDISPIFYVAAVGEWPVPIKGADVKGQRQWDEEVRRRRAEGRSTTRGIMASSSVSYRVTVD